MSGAPVDRAVREKVLAYVVRRSASRLQVLVFDHVDAPEAGTQVPAGGIDPGETPEQACLREILEEAGIGARLVRYVGAFDYDATRSHGQIHRRHVFVAEPLAPLPDVWVHTVRSAAADDGMRFSCFWLDVAGAARRLAGGQGDYLAAAFPEPS